MAADEAFSIVIFGASGDLTHRKLIPALWTLFAARTLPEPFTILCTARTPMSDDEFRAKLKDGVKQFARFKVPNDQVWQRFAANVFYVPGDPTAPSSTARSGPGSRSSSAPAAPPATGCSTCPRPPASTPTS